MSGESCRNGEGLGAKPATVDILGTPIAVVTRASFVEALEQWLISRTNDSAGVFVCFRDAHGIVRAWEEPELQNAHNLAFINAPDGMPLVWLARRRGHRIQRVCGPDLLPEVCRLGLTKRWRHVFYGGASDTASQLKTNLERRFPGIDIADVIVPPFHAMTDDETDAAIQRINSSAPHFVWVGLGSPKQDLWMACNAPRIKGAILMGVGAAFDLHAGVKQRAPVWIQKLGLEWAYRLTIEPRRLGRRYASTVPRFIYHAIRQELTSGALPLK